MKFEKSVRCFENLIWLVSSFRVIFHVPLNDGVANMMKPIRVLLCCALLLVWRLSKRVS